LLIVGATAVIRHARAHPDKHPKQYTSSPILERPKRERRTVTKNKVLAWMAIRP
jgi:hypothetical protein